MPIVPTIDGNQLINALRMGRQDRDAFEDRKLQQMFMQQKMETARREAERQNKVDEAYRSIFGGGEAPAPSEQTGVPVAPATPQPRQAVNPDKLRRLMALGPEGVQAAKVIMDMSAAQLKATRERVTGDLELKGRIIGGIRALPEGQRQAAYDDAKARLAEAGTDISRLPQQWDEGYADQVVRESLEVAKALDMDQEAMKFSETVRHNRATEANAAGNLAVRQGALGLARQREGRIASGKGEDGDNSDLNYLMDD